MGTVKSVVIVGGGIGGLSTALALHHVNIPVQVYEKASRFTEVGAGVNLSPNSVRVLDHAGVGPELMRQGTPTFALASLMRFDGAPVCPLSGPGARAMHRADLIDLLVKALPPDSLHVNKRCTGFRQDGDHAKVVFSDGTTATADVVIAADGIRSVLREYVAPGYSPVSSGYAVYRGLIYHKEHSRWPELINQIWMGHGRHLVVFPVRGERAITHVWFVPRQDATADPSRAEDVKAVLRDHFSGWNPLVQSIIEEVTPCLRLEVFDLDPVPLWTRGRLALIGDAAHAMQPHLAQGANQAIEDAGALAVILAHANYDDVPTALRQYEGVRKERATRIQRASREQGLFYDSNGAEKNAPLGGFPYREAFMDWLYNYDVLKAAELMP